MAHQRKVKPPEAPHGRSYFRVHHYLALVPDLRPFCFNVIASARCRLGQNRSDPQDDIDQGHEPQHCLQRTSRTFNKVHVSLLLLSKIHKHNAYICCLKQDGHVSSRYTNTMRTYVFSSKMDMFAYVLHIPAHVMVAWKQTVREHTRINTFVNACAHSSDWWLFSSQNIGRSTQNYLFTSFTSKKVWIKVSE